MDNNSKTHHHRPNIPTNSGRKALSLPELLSPIFEQLYIDDDTAVIGNPDGPSDEGSDDYTETYVGRCWTLRSCALVNKRWSSTDPPNPLKTPSGEGSTPA
ncbi:hypothetical protein BDV06DRAFT_226611 [Aspergillus oleicola]